MNGLVGSKVSRRHVSMVFSLSVFCLFLFSLNLMQMDREWEIKEVHHGGASQETMTVGIE